MARLVTVEVEGLSFCYIRNSRWHVTFVSDAVHALWFKAPNTKPLGLANGTNKLILEFEADEEPQAQPQFPSEGIPNMSDSRAHGEEQPGKSWLSFQRSNEFGTGILDMELPQSILELGPKRWSYRWMQRVKGNGGGVKYRIDRKVTKRLTFKFTLRSDHTKALKVWLRDVTLGTRVLLGEFPEKETESDLKFQFNNDCGGKCKGNDSIHLYDIFFDRSDSTKRFVSGRLIGGDVPGNDPNKPWPINRKTMRPMSPTYGNCDPTGSEPAPDGPPWPPFA